MKKQNWHRAIKKPIRKGWREGIAYFFYSTIFACGIMDAITYFLFWMGYGFGYGDVPRWAFATFMLLWGVLGLLFTKEGQNKKEW